MTDAMVENSGYPFPCRLCIYHSLLVKDKVKYFCIGRNKTGTISIQRAFLDLGYIVGLQRTAEELLRHYQQSDFDAIIKYCKTGEVFQDVPFSCPETYKYLDKASEKDKIDLMFRFIQYVERQIVLTTPKHATWYALQGWEVFDYHQSLGMEPEYYENVAIANDGN